jgi:hypothetical protein
MTEPALRFAQDRAGFPLLWIEDLRAYIHWFPVTKLQCEYFLCAEPDRRFDESWYDELLTLNPRITPTGINARNYWQALLSGITPSEAQRFARWCGEDYDIPTQKEWLQAYRYLKTLPPATSPDVLQQMGELRPRTRTLLQRLDEAARNAIKEGGYEYTLADQMLMRMGVMEWVACADLRPPWGGLGKTPSELGSRFSNPDQGTPSKPTDPEIRSRAYGCRLLRRAV